MRCIDLFSGCGGMSLGFSLAGYEVVAAFDFIFIGTKTQVDQMVGNAAPANLARAVAEAIAKHN